MTFRSRTTRTALAVSVVALAAAGCSGGYRSAGRPSPTTLPSPATRTLPAGLTSDGFPQVAASTTLTPGTATQLHNGGITVRIPAGAVGVPATFELLAGSVASWASYAPTGQRVVAAFAFRVVDTTTHALVTSFAAPVVVSVTNPSIGATSRYWNTSATTPPRVVANPVPPKIAGHTLTHGNPTAAVGWLVTTPAG